jgi:hypothetical protein
MAGEYKDEQKSKPNVMIVLLAVFALLTACQANAPSNHAESIALPADSSAQVYQFTADPLASTTLLFESPVPDLPFTAEVKDSAGKLVATLGSGALQNATFTLPAGDMTYEITIASPGSSKVLVSLTHNQTATAAPPAPSEFRAASTIPVSYTPNRVQAEVCSISSDNPGGANIRSNPLMTAPAVQVLPQGIAVQADVRTVDGWYRVNFNGAMGWIFGDVVILSGLCSSLPVQSNDTTAQGLAMGGAVIPGVTAPYDVDSYYFGLNRDTGGRFVESISYPNGDSIDRVLVTVDSTAGAVFARTFALTLTCSGTGTEFLRWGTTDNPALACGDSLPLPLTNDFNAINFVVTFPGGVGQSYVDYVLLAEPIAPADQPAVGLGLDRDVGGQFSDAISYPNGDTNDLIQLSVSNLANEPANYYREFYLTLVCSGSGLEAVRWGLPENPTVTCGSTVTTQFSYADVTGSNLLNLAVTFPQGSAPGYVTYTLRAVPAAPYDAGQYTFGPDRDSGGQFNETISFPDGDRRDLINLSVPNLTTFAPYNQREFTVTLVCSGAGVENVRWGTPDNPEWGCNSAVNVPLTYSANSLPLVVSLPDTTPARGYIHYTLVAVPKQ